MKKSVLSILIFAVICIVGGVIAVSYYGSFTSSNDDFAMVNDYAERYYDYFRENQAFRVLLGDNGIDSESMALFAVLSLDKPDFENGNGKEEYDEITEKYFGRRLESYNNSSINEDVYTGKVKPTGWSFDNSVYMVLKSLESGGDNRKIGVFYCLNVSDSVFNDMLENNDVLTVAEEKAQLFSGDFKRFEKYGVSPFLVRVEFEEKFDDAGNLYFRYFDVEVVK